MRVRRRLRRSRVASSRTALAPSAGGRAVEHAGEPLDAGLRVRVLLGVAHELRGHDSPVAELARERAERRGRVDRAEQGVERVALAGLDALREVDLLLVRQDPTSRGLGGSGGSNGRGNGVVRRGCVGKRVELERFADGLSADGSRGCEGSARYVHGRLTGLGCRAME